MDKDGAEDGEIQPRSNDLSNDEVLTLTIDLVRAYVANHTVPSAQIGPLLEQTHRAVLSLNDTRADLRYSAYAEQSIKPEALVCLECGREFRSLKRHLAACHGLTPEHYRANWVLKSNYPMVAPNYAKKRSRLAVDNGFGRKGGGAPTKNPRRDKKKES